MRLVTVRDTIYGIQSKLGVGSKQEMVVWAVRNGLLDDWVDPCLYGVVRLSSGGELRRSG